MDSGPGMKNSELDALNRKLSMDNDLYFKSLGNEPRKSIGIEKCKPKNQAVFGDSYGLKIESEQGEYTGVIVSLPSKWEATEGTMFKVIIIDDEPIIRKGIKNIINWKQFDCVICAEASDGEEGKMVIHKHLPDIIITDIHMPDTDGLKMIRDIKNIVPNCKIIILTGYRDFDYVQEAIKLGVFDFVLKPSKIEELTAVVSKAILELNSMKSRAEELDKLKRLFEQNIPILKEKLLYDIIYEIYPSKADILSRAGLLGVCINRFVLLAVEIDNEDDNEKLSQYDSHLYQFGIVNTFMEVFSDSFEVLSIPLNGKGAAFILQPTAKVTGYMELVNQKCDYVQEMITNCFGFTVTIAVSSEGTGIMQLAEKFSECREALERKFYLGSNTTIFQDDLNTFIKFDDYSVLEKYQKHLLDSIKTGNKRLVAERLEDIFSYINGLERVNMEYLKSFFADHLNDQQYPPVCCTVRG